MSGTQSWCGHADDYQIEIRIWVAGMPRQLRDDSNCLKMLSSITVCADCKEKIKVDDLLTPEGKARICTGLAKIRKPEPDFTSAKLIFLEVIDKPLSIRDIIPPGADVTEA